MLMSFVVDLLTLIPVISLATFLVGSIVLILRMIVAARGYKPREHVRGAYLEFEVSAGMFPEHWTTSPINAYAESLPSCEWKRTKASLERAASKYPNDFHFPLNVIYVVKSLTFYETRYGGTYTAPLRNYVYITNDGFGDDFVERLFHAEFSSVLHKLNPDFLSEALWKQQLPHDFIYTHPNETDVALTQLGEHNESFEPELLELGFLSLYATTNLENDFNSVTKQLFVPASELWQIIDQYPRIRKKVELTVKFYHQLHPAFTEDYFRTLSKVQRP